MAPAPAADLEAGQRKSEPCKACHGADGNATIPGTPSLAGQPVYFTHWQLIKYRDGRRKDPQMSPLAEKLSDDDMADLAAFYAVQTATRRPAKLDAQKIEDGKKAAAYYQCTSCHRTNLAGLDSIKRASSFSVGRNNRLTSLQGLESLTDTENLNIDHNPQLTGLGALQSLARAPVLSVVSNPLIPSCQVRALSARVGSETVFNDGNNTTATCR